MKKLSLFVLVILSFSFQISSQEITWHPTVLFAGVLPGQVFLPGRGFSTSYSFTANDRRVYIVDNSELKHFQFPRRVLEPLYPLYRTISLARLSNGSGFILSSNGQQSSYLQASEIFSFHEQIKIMEFPAAPGGLILDSSGSLYARDFWGQRYFSLVHSSDSSLETYRILSETQLKITMEHQGRSINYLITFGVQNHFSTRGIPGLSLDFHGNPELPYSIHQIPEPNTLEKDGRFIGALFPSSPQLPMLFFYVSRDNNSIFGLDILGERVSSAFYLNQWGFTSREFQFTHNGLLALTSPQWQLVLLDFSYGDKEIFSRLIGGLVDSFTHTKPSTNHLLESRLSNPLEFPGILQQFSQPNIRPTINRINALYRVLYYPVFTGEVVNRDLRKSALSLIENFDPPWYVYAAMISMLRYEYDPGLGLSMLDIISQKSWPLFVDNPMAVTSYLLSTARNFNEDHVFLVLEIYKTLKAKIEANVLSEIFPTAFWDRLLGIHSSRIVREAILAR